MDISVSSEAGNLQQSWEDLPAGMERFRNSHSIIISYLRERNFAQKIRGRFTANAIKRSAERLLSQFKSFIQENPGFLEGDSQEAGSILGSCVAVLDYYDDLQASRYVWLSRITKPYYQVLASDPIAQSRLLCYFQLGLIYLHIEYRRRPSDHHALEKKFEQMEKHVVGLYGLNSAPAYGLVRRYYDLRSQVVRQTSERYEADRFIDLATSCADMEQQLDADRKEEILAEKMLSIGLTRIWLQIAKGYYVHAQELLKLVDACLGRYENDPITRAKYLVARNVCRRALAGKDPKQLRQIIRELTEALHIFDELGDRRHLLRCYHELCLCFLLLGDHSKVSDDLQFMESFAKAAIQNPSIGWQIQYYLMDSRLACQLQNYEYARTRAEEAVSLATSSGMDLLTIEAKNTLAMVLFRTNQLVLAEKHLQDALQMNHDGLRQTDHGDLSQPALCGVSLLYLARVELLKGEKMLALRTLHEWRNISHRVEHKWVKNLAAEVEQQAVHQCLTEYVNADAASMDFPRQLLLLRKVSIERASRKLGSTKIVDIAKELNVNRQTVHSWLKELRKELMPASI